MKLEQLFEETANDYRKRLIADFQIPTLGGGAYSTVHQHPAYKDIAVKFVIDDPKYIEYAKFCVKNKSNPYLPKIIDIVPVELDDYKDDRAYIVFMEKLTPSNNFHRGECCEYFLSPIPDYELLDVDIEYNPPQNLFLDFDRDVWKLVMKYHNDKNIKQFAKFCYDHNASDLHAGNIFMRGEQIVFIDPIAS